MSIETFMGCLESSIDELCKGDPNMTFKNNDSRFIKFGKNKNDVKFTGTNQHSNIVGVSYYAICLLN